MTNKTLGFSPMEWVVLMSKMINSPRISYKMSGLKGKVRNLKTTPPEAINHLDCSGFVQYVLFKTTINDERLPGGSSNQRDYLKVDYENVSYEDVGEPENTDVLYIAFRKTTSSRQGHVWFVYNGRTYECTKTKTPPRNGPTSFDWGVRKRECDFCFILGHLNLPHAQLDMIPGIASVIKIAYPPK